MISNHLEEGVVSSGRAVLERNPSRQCDNDLTPGRLRLSNGGTVEGYLEGLRRHYPATPADTFVDVVDFHVAPSDSTHTGEA